MLKKIPSIMSPELMKTLMEMGHGDEICLADANFPSVSIGRRIIRLDGHGITDILGEILDFFPLDSFCTETSHINVSGFRRQRITRYLEPLQKNYTNKRGSKKVYEF